MKNTYQQLIAQIRDTFTEGRTTTVKIARRQMLLTYWAIGRHIVEFEQGGQEKAIYGSELIKRLSKDLSHQLNHRFDRSTLIYIRLIYLNYKNKGNLSHLLTWSHYLELLKIDNDLERNFYEKQAILEKWTVRELKRQKNTSLFLRLAASKDKETVLKMSKQGKLVEKPEDILRDPYVFEFLKIPDIDTISEKDLETHLIDHLQSFLLELGKGFALSWATIPDTYRWGRL